MPHIAWADQAFVDLERLYRHLEPHSADSAMRAIKAVEAEVEQLRNHPELGKAIAARPGTRQLIVNFGKAAYLVRYRYIRDEVSIISVRHSREQARPGID